MKTVGFQKDIQVPDMEYVNRLRGDAPMRVVSDEARTSVRTRSSAAVVAATRPLRIACIGARGIPSNYSGIERVCEDLYSELAKRGHDITVYCRPEYVAKKGMHRGVTLRSVPALRTRSLDTLSHVAASLMHAVTVGRYDVLHLHALAPGLFTSLCRAARMPIVATVHGLDWKRAKWKGSGARLLKWAERSIARNADQIIVLSGELEQHFQEEYGRETVRIPNGVAEPAPGESERTEVLAQFGLQPKGFCLYLGRLVPEKRVEDLISAFKRIPGQQRLAIAGEGRFTDGYVGMLKQLAADDSRIVFTGAQERPAVHTLFRNAAVYVLPSEVEGLPMSLLECMQHGTPAVVSDIPPHRELLSGTQHYDLFFPVKDTEALQGRLTAALTHAEHYRNVAADLRVLVRRCYSWPSIADRTEKVFYRAMQPGVPALHEA